MVRSILPLVKSVVRFLGRSDRHYIGDRSLEKIPTIKCVTISKRSRKQIFWPQVECLGCYPRLKYSWSDVVINEASCSLSSSISLVFLEEPVST